ncbi:MAG: DUF2442 domain-containing protein [Kiritimatiellales bacterium]
MYHDAVDVICEDGFVLRVTFDDGKTGRIDCRPLIAKGGQFKKLSDPMVFQRAKVDPELGVVTWDNEIDIAPETAYSLATGTPLPDWMNPAQLCVAEEPAEYKTKPEE